MDKKMLPKVFIGSSVESLKIAKAIQAELEHDAELRRWDQGVMQATSNALDDLLTFADNCDFGVFVFSSEDELRMRDKSNMTVRDNVLFEFGIFLGKLGKARNFFVRPRKDKSSHIATDLLGVTPLEFYLPESQDDLQSALSAACNQIRGRLEKLGPKKVIYDSTKGSQVKQLIGTAGHDRYDKPGEISEGEFKTGNDGIVTIFRTNKIGRFEIRLESPIVKSRTFRVSFEAQVDKGERDLNIVLKDEITQKMSDKKIIRLNSQTWTTVTAVLKTPEVFFRIDDQEVSDPSGKLEIRNLLVSED